MFLKGAVRKNLRRKKKYIHQVRDSLRVEIFDGIAFEEESNLRAATKGIPARVGVDIERVLISAGAEDILCRVGVLRSLSRNRSHLYAIGDQETRRQ